jgi:hypothetical protein
MATRSGLRIDLLKPKFDDLTIEEVAESLAKINRFAGHTRGMVGYSDAQHSVLVSRRCMELAFANHLTRRQQLRLSLYGLLHDAHEAIMGDITSPVKDALIMLGAGTSIKTLDSVLRLEMETRFAGAPIDKASVLDGLTGRMDYRYFVKRADLELLATEQLHLTNRQFTRDDYDYPPLHAWSADVVQPWAPERAKQEFIGVYESLQFAIGVEEIEEVLS